MKYFMPDWDDRLDVNYDFLNDRFSPEHVEKRRDADKFVHEFVTPAPYDGLLISLATFGKKTPRKKIRVHPWELEGHGNIRDYFRVPRRMKVMGDCGAFTYVAEPSPPPQYSPAAVARAYDELGVDYGFSVDHLAVPFVKRPNRSGKVTLTPLSPSTRRRRVEISLKNAKKFLRVCEKERYNFEPIGVAQGLNPTNYATSARALVSMGYQYIALGGLVQYATSDLLQIVESVRETTPSVKLHLLGVLRPSALPALRRAKVTSFDSASFLRKAWLRSGQNYLGSDGLWYAAIRVPQLSHHEEAFDAPGLSPRVVQSMELSALQTLRAFAREEVSIDTCIDRVMKYDRLLLRNSEEDEQELRAAYRRTLAARPWEKCPCPICKDIGVEVIVFRGLNRNKRRGFHNSWIFRHHILKRRGNPASGLTVMTEETCPNTGPPRPKELVQID